MTSDTARIHNYNPATRIEIDGVQYSVADLLHEYWRLQSECQALVNTLESTEKALQCIHVCVSEYEWHPAYNAEEAAWELVGELEEQANDEQLRELARLMYGKALP